MVLFAANIEGKGILKQVDKSGIVLAHIPATTDEIVPLSGPKEFSFYIT